MVTKVLIPFATLIGIPELNARKHQFPAHGNLRFPLAKGIKQTSARKSKISCTRKCTRSSPNFELARVILQLRFRTFTPRLFIHALKDMT